MPSAKKHPAAVALGKRNKGVPKTMTPAALAQRQKAGFKPKRLPKETVAAALAAAQDEHHWTAAMLPPPTDSSAQSIEDDEDE